MSAHFSSWLGTAFFFRTQNPPAVTTCMKQEEESLEFEFPSDNNLLASCVDMSSIAFLGMNLGRVGIQLMSSLTFSFSLFNSVELTVSSTTYRTKKTTNRAHPITIKNIVI